MKAAPSPTPNPMPSLVELEMPGAEDEADSATAAAAVLDAAKDASGEVGIDDSDGAGDDVSESWSTAAMRNVGLLAVHMSQSFGWSPFCSRKNMSTALTSCSSFVCHRYVFWP